MYDGKPMISQYDVVDATFQPQRKDNLKPKASNWIGVRALWEASWIIEKGPYKNQWAFAFKSSDFESDMPPFSWVPECDLIIHSTIERLALTDGSITYTPTGPAISCDLSACAKCGSPFDVAREWTDKGFEIRHTCPNGCKTGLTIISFFGPKLDAPPSRAAG
jgi:hypothetical protein